MFLAIDIWLEYVQYCIGNCGKEETNKILEEGLRIAGLNANQGSLLWDVLRELEVAKISLHAPLGVEWHAQVGKAADAFKRQLSVPMLNMEQTFHEWSQWLEQLPEGHKIDHKTLDWGYSQALKLLKIYRPFEEQLLAVEDNEELYSIYKEYIKVVKDPPTIICLYERAVAQLSLNSNLWNDYCLYAMSLGDVSKDISKKALRNCPWAEDLWVLRMRILEFLNAPESEAMQCLELGLTSILPSPGLNLWLTYLEYVRRTSTSPEHVHKVFTQAAEQLTGNGDDSCQILRLQARLYTKQDNIKEARKIWSQILQLPTHRTTAFAWLEYAALEKQYGDPQHLRTLYSRALTTCTDWPQYIQEDWLMYERECGSLKDILKCVQKCNSVQPVTRQEPKKRSHENGTEEFKPKRKRTEERPPPPKKLSPAEMDTDLSVFLSNMHEEVNEMKLQDLFPNALAICIPLNRRGTSKCYAYIQFSSIEEVEKALLRDREPIDGRPLFISKCQKDRTQRSVGFKYSAETEEKKLFVRGLPHSYSQEDVLEVFKSHGALTVRLVTYKSGQSKGLAYVEFENPEAAQKAMKATDGVELAGHTITVAISAPPAKKSTEVPLKSSTSISHPRGRLQMPLIPRVLKTKPVEAAASSSKSNNDFRKMFFNNK